jgi:putative DNA primase/helicase
LKAASDALQDWAAKHPGQKYSDHWLPFADAWPGVLHHGLEGPGLVIRKEDGLVGVDFDGCVVNGVIDAGVMTTWLQGWFVNTYSEFSPSGTGIHVLGLGKIRKSLTPTPLPESNGVKVEVYNKDRFFTFTGKPVPR